MCLLKLFKFKIDDKIVLNNDELNETLITNQEISKFNGKLDKYGLQSFQHRFIKKNFNFTHKLINVEASPVLLRNTVLNADKSITRTLRVKLCLT
jgi:hypothetical protein